MLYERCFDYLDMPFSRAPEMPLLPCRFRDAAVALLLRFSHELFSAVQCESGVVRGGVCRLLVMARATRSAAFSACARVRAQSDMRVERAVHMSALQARAVRRQCDRQRSKMLQR